MASIYDLDVTDIKGNDVSLGDYRDKVLLIVNVASQCGLTNQYAGLQALQHQFDDLEVLGFPCNQFGAQEPGDDAEICEFANSQYGVDFPMFSKIEVNGDGAAPLYKLLKAEQPGEGDSAEIQWNFEKFLIDREGNVARRFSPMTTPEQVADVIPEYL
jgi:glutathione peroxidase